MPLFLRSYSGLITKGLGMPACCGLLTMGFGVYKCTIEIFDQFGGGGVGGGSIVVAPGVFVPMPKKMTQTTKMVLITVKYGQDKAWRRPYVVDRTKAAIIVRAVNILNATLNKLSVNVERVQRLARKVAATFKRGDK